MNRFTLMLDVYVCVYLPIIDCRLPLTSVVSVHTSWLLIVDLTECIIMHCILSVCVMAKNCFMQSKMRSSSLNGVGMVTHATSGC